MGTTQWHTCKDTDFGVTVVSSCSKQTTSADLGPIPFIFMQFSAKILSNNRFLSQTQRLAPPPPEKFWIRHWLSATEPEMKTKRGRVFLKQKVYVLLISNCHLIPLMEIIKLKRLYVYLLVEGLFSFSRESINLYSMKDQLILTLVSEWTFDQEIVTRHWVSLSEELHLPHINETRRQPVIWTGCL